MTPFKKLLLLAIFTFPLVVTTACSEGPISYFDGLSVDQQADHRLVSFKEAITIADPQELPAVYVRHAAEKQRIEVFQQGQKTASINYRANPADINPYSAKNGPWEVSFHETFSPTGKRNSWYKSKEKGAWEEKTYNVEGKLVDHTLHQANGSERTDTYRGQKRIMDSKISDSTAVNENGLNELVYEFYDENEIVRISEHWEDVFETETDGTKVKVGSTMRLTVLYDPKGELYAQFYREGDERNTHPLQEFTRMKSALLTEITQE